MTTTTTTPFLNQRRLVAVLLRLVAVLLRLVALPLRLGGLHLGFLGKLRRICCGTGRSGASCDYMIATMSPFSNTVRFC